LVVIGSACGGDGVKDCKAHVLANPSELRRGQSHAQRLANGESWTV
jgi:hypothetical protein